MKIDQFLFGYKDGHRLLAGTTNLSDSLVWELVRTTDRPSTSDRNLENGITFGFPLDDKYYALCRTWAAKEIARPGAVWTHVLLLSEGAVSPLQFLPLLHETRTPVIAKFREQIFYHHQDNAYRDTSFLSNEAAHLLMALAAKPRSGLRVKCSIPPLELLSNAYDHWHGILIGQAFSTSSSKKDIVADKRAVIVSFGDDLDGYSHTERYPQIASYQIPSKRISHSWNKLNHDIYALEKWLSKTRYSFHETASNLKLALETLLLGTGELDDDKLLARISSARRPNGDEDILRYCLGKPIGPFNAPPSWISALYLLGEEDWGEWANLIDSYEVGCIASTAPASALAERLGDLASASLGREALKALASKISSSAFRELFDISVDAAGVLIELEPDLLHSLPESQKRYSNFSTYKFNGDVDQRIANELNLLSWTPFFWKGSVERKARKSFSNENLVQYVLNRIDDNTWNGQHHVIKDFLLKTPHLLDALLRSSEIKESFHVALQEFSLADIQESLINAQENGSNEVDKIVDGMIAEYGADHALPLLKQIPIGKDPDFIARVAEARWRKSKNKRVIARIRNELGTLYRAGGTMKHIKSKGLLKALDSD